MTSSRTSITMQVPASTSNCGPGFDTLGIALSLYNFVRVELTADAGQAIRYIGEAELREQTEAMAAAVAAAFTKASGIATAPFSFEVWGQVPLARGLGSSSTVRCGILAGLNALHGSPLNQQQIAAIGSELDGAADNTVALVYGGFTIARTDPASGAFERCLRCDVDEDVSFCVVSPQTKVFTTSARTVLPEQFPFIDAVRSINSACTLTAAFFSRDYEQLRDSVTDYMHQPYRSRLCPFMNEAIAAGEAAGAWCGWLSGSGSSVLCVGPRKHAAAIVKAMSDVYSSQGIENQCFKLSADNLGLRPADLEQQESLLQAR